MLIKEINNTYSIIETDDIEIKHFLIDILSVYLPGYKFMPSVKAGLSDGKKKFFRITPQGSLLIPSGLYGLIQNKLDEKEYNYEVQRLQQEHNYHLTTEEADEFIKSCNLPFEPYWYQKEAFIDAINDKRKVMLLATSSGKSLIISLVLEYLRLKGLRTVLIVPNINLLEQFSSDILSYNLTELHKHVHLVGGENKIKHFDNNITITTWASCNKMMELWKDIDCIIADECLHPNTKITMKDSVKCIKDIKVGDELLTYNETTHKKEINKVIKVHKNISKEKMYKISTDEGILKITGNHKVNTDRGWVRVDELLISDNILSL